MKWHWGGLRELLCEQLESLLWRAQRQEYLCHAYLLEAGANKAADSKSGPLRKAGPTRDVARERRRLAAGGACFDRDWCAW